MFASYKKPSNKQQNFLFLKSCEVFSKDKHRVKDCNNFLYYVSTRLSFITFIRKSYKQEINCISFRKNCILDKQNI